MWVFSTSLPNLSLICLLTTEIYYLTGITGNTDRQTDRHTDRYTDTQTESDILPLEDMRSSKNNPKCLYKYHHVVQLDKIATVLHDSFLNSYTINNTRLCLLSENYTGIVCLCVQTENQATLVRSEICYDTGNWPNKVSESV